MDPRQLLGHLQPEPGWRALHDAPPDRLARDARHRERLATVDLPEVGDRLRHADTGLARGDEHLELVAQRQRVQVDHAAERAPHEQLPPVRVSTAHASFDAPPASSRASTTSVPSARASASLT